MHPIRNWPDWLFIVAVCSGMLAYLAFGRLAWLALSPVALLLWAMIIWLDCRRADPRDVERALERGLCPRCGYDLRATPGRCPECGAASVTDSA